MYMYICIKLCLITSRNRIAQSADIMNYYKKAQNQSSENTEAGH